MTPERATSIWGLLRNVFLEEAGLGLDLLLLCWAFLRKRNSLPMQETGKQLECLLMQGPPEGYQDTNTQHVTIFVRIGETGGDVAAVAARFDRHYESFASKREQMFQAWHQKVWLSMLLSLGCHIVEFEATSMMHRDWIQGSWPTLCAPVEHW